MSGWDPSKFVVYEKQCGECLFSANKIVSDERKAEVLAASPAARMAKAFRIVEFVPLPQESDRS